MDLATLIEIEEALLGPLALAIAYLFRRCSSLAERVAWLEGRSSHALNAAGKEE